MKYDWPTVRKLILEAAAMISEHDPGDLFNPELPPEESEE